MNLKLLAKNVSFRVSKRLPFSHHNRVTRRRVRMLHDYKCIFVHIPKTAGNAVTAAINKLPLTSQPVGPVIRKHSTAVETRAIVGTTTWTEYFTFAFVRNPWDLMVSSYHWWLQKAPTYMQLSNPDVRAIAGMTGFTDYIRSKYGRTMINEIKGNMFDWISEDDEVIVDFVGKFETLDSDWHTVCDRIGVEHAPLPHVNATKRRPYTDYYTDETQQIVAERFKRTIDYFGYKY